MTPDVLAFADKRTEGLFPVTEPSGTTVALIRVSFWSTRTFEALTGSGEPLCTGKHRSWLSSWWDAVDHEGVALASVGSQLLGGRKKVLLPDERTLVLQGRWFGRDWSLRDEQGADVLSSEPSSGAWSFRPDEWVVRCHDASLSLAQVVAIVELNRLMVKAARSQAASA